VLQARERLTELQSSWEFAFAMGHGCSIGGDPRFDEIRREVEDLRAIISEHQPPAAAAS
jgi:hypothetical protein